MRVIEHSILGKEKRLINTEIIIDGKSIPAIEGEVIAAALLANGIRKFRVTEKDKKSRGIYCGIGCCTDCIMTVDGQPNVRTCVTPVRNGMIIETQEGFGKWGDK